jgi:hypothetical protein
MWADDDDVRFVLDQTFVILKVGLNSGCDSYATDLRSRFQHRYLIAVTTQVIASENIRRKDHRKLSQQSWNYFNFLVISLPLLSNCHLKT